jgi:hypothetical protein
MKSTKMPGALVILLLPLLAGPLFGQQRVFNWLPANDESVRLDPANYHTGRAYHPGTNGGNIHVDIKAQRPVTIFLTPTEEWNNAVQHPEALGNLRQLCPREHVVETTYECNLPPDAMTLIIRDERNSLDRAVFAGLGAVLDPNDKADRATGVGIVTVLTGQGSATRRFTSPNDVHIQYYRWDCVENCIQPEIQWTREVKEKYELTSFLKVYGGFAPDHDREQVSIKIKSPVPMVVAMLPSQIADQLHAQPETLESALQKNPCQQRGVQSLQFECTFNVADGPQAFRITRRLKLRCWRPDASPTVPCSKANDKELHPLGLIDLPILRREPDPGACSGSGD